MSVVKFGGLNLVVLFVFGLTGCSSGFEGLRPSATAQSSAVAGTQPTEVPPTLATPTPSPVVNPPPVYTGIELPGVNLASADTNTGKAGARLHYDYEYPSTAEIDYFVSKGMKVIRVPFDANRLQPKRGGELSQTEFGYLDDVVQYAKVKGIKVILDPHNYGSLLDNDGVSRVLGVDPLMPGSNLADFWSKVASAYQNQSNVIFGLMNEPYAQTAEQWKEVAVLSVSAIRATGATQKILIPGTWYTGAHSWVASGNAEAWKGFTDPNFAFEVHQYLDSDSSGTHGDCVDKSGSTSLEVFTTWARANHVRGFLGEIGWATNAQCMSEGDAVISYMHTNSDVWLGYSYWAAGPWWGDYMYTLEPEGLGTASVVDRPQISILQKY